MNDTRGKSNHLTQQELRRLREGYETGVTIAKLADELNVNSRTVDRWFRKLRLAGVVRGEHKCTFK